MDEFDLLEQGFEAVLLATERGQIEYFDVLAMHCSYRSHDSAEAVLLDSGRGQGWDDVKGWILATIVCYEESAAQYTDPSTRHGQQRFAAEHKVWYVTLVAHQPAHDIEEKKRVESFKDELVSWTSESLQAFEGPEHLGSILSAGCFPDILDASRAKDRLNTVSRLMTQCSIGADFNEWLNVLPERPPTTP